MTCAKLAYMNSLALSVGVSNCTLEGGAHVVRTPRRRTLSESMKRAYHDIGIEQVVYTELR